MLEWFCALHVMKEKCPIRGGGLVPLTHFSNLNITLTDNTLDTDTFHLVYFPINWQRSEPASGESLQLFA